MTTTSVGAKLTRAPIIRQVASAQRRAALSQKLFERLIGVAPAALLPHVLALIALGELLFGSALALFRHTHA